MRSLSDAKVSISTWRVMCNIDMMRMNIKIGRRVFIVGTNLRIRPSTLP